MTYFPTINKVAFLWWAIFLAGCGAYKTVLVRERQVENAGLYKVNKPIGEWKWHDSKIIRYGTAGVAADDVLFWKCPGPQQITILRADYRRDGQKKEFHVKVEKNSLEEVAVRFLQSFYEKMGVKDARFLEHRKISLSGYEAVEVLAGTREKFPVACDSTRLALRELKSKFVLIKRGDWGYTALSKKGRFPMMIILWYSSPIETFDEGVGELDRMAQEFRFVEN